MAYHLVMRRWRIEASIVFPRELPPMSGGAFPQRLEPVTRILECGGRVDGIRIALRPSEQPPVDLMHDVASLVFIVDLEGDADAALDLANPVIESTIESLSYQLQVVLHVHDLEVIEITAPVVVGEERDILNLPAPQGYNTIAFKPAMTPLGVRTRLQPDPRTQLDKTEPRSSRALDWYLKALRSDLQADQFMFFWIATEILASGSGIRVEEPWITRCGHRVESCPECDKETKREIQGQSRQAYLRQVFGLQPAEARQVWEMRQMLHGAIPLASEKMASLPQLSSLLRVGLILELNSRLALTGSDAPRLDANHVLVGPEIGLAGSRIITQWHSDRSRRIERVRDK